MITVTKNPTNVIFGQSCGILSHVIKPKKDNLILYVKKVKIGNNVFLGASSYLGPGVIIEEKNFIVADSKLYANTIVDNSLDKKQIELLNQQN